MLLQSAEQIEGADAWAEYAVLVQYMSDIAKKFAHRKEMRVRLDKMLSFWYHVSRAVGHFRRIVK